MATPARLDQDREPRLPALPARAWGRPALRSRRVVL